jgi:hypothetical protein
MGLCRKSKTELINYCTVLNSVLRGVTHIHTYTVCVCVCVCVCVRAGARVCVCVHALVCNGHYSDNGHLIGKG